MKRTFTLLAALVFIAMDLFALKPIQGRNSATASRLAKFNHERTGKGIEHHLFSERKPYQNQATRLKSAQAIKQRLDGYSSMALDEITGQWHPDEKYEFIYDAHWNLVKVLGYEWYENTNELVYNWREEYTYDVNNNLTQTVYLSLDETTNQFVVHRKYLDTYDENGNLAQEISYSRNETTNQLYTDRKYEYSYNIGGKETLQLGYNWHPSTNQWFQHNKTVTTYDSKGYAILKLESYWDEIKLWYNIAKEELTYDTVGNLILSLYSSINNGEWKPNYKDVYTFDDKGNNTQSFYYGNWDVSTNQWNYVSKSETTFDNNYTTNDLILPYEDDDWIFTHKITEIKDYNWNNDTKAWILDYKFSLTYSSQNVTSIKSLDAELSRVYPNPISESVSFSIPGFYSQITFELFDLQGRKLMLKAIGSNEKVNMEGFRSGMYLYKLNVDDKVQSGKLVKE